MNEQSRWYDSMRYGSRTFLWCYKLYSLVINPWNAAVVCIVKKCHWWEIWFNISDLSNKITRNYIWLYCQPCASVNCRVSVGFFMFTLLFFTQLWCGILNTFTWCIGHCDISNGKCNIFIFWYYIMIYCIICILQCPNYKRDIAQHSKEKRCEITQKVKLWNYHTH